MDNPYNPYTFVQALNILKDAGSSKFNKEIALETVDSCSDLATKEELEFIKSKIKEIEND